MLFEQFSSIYMYVKIVGKTQDQHFDIILQSKEQDPKKSENYVINLSPTFNKNQDLVPGIG